MILKKKNLFMNNAKIKKESKVAKEQNCVSSV